MTFVLDYGFNDPGFLTNTIREAYTRVINFFAELKATATQLTTCECWRLIVTKAMEVLMGQDPPDLLPQAG